MSRRSPDDLVGAWLEEGPVAVSAERRGQMLGDILATPQSRRWRTRLRERFTFSPVGLGMSAAATIAVVVAGTLALTSLPRIAGPLAPSPTLPSSPPPSVQPLASIDLGHRLTSMVVTADAVWAGGEAGITRIDPQTNQAAPEISVPNPDGRFAVAFESLWVADDGKSLLRRVDPVSGTVLAEIPIGVRPDGIAVTDGAVWVGDRRNGMVTRVDPATNAVVATIEVGPREQGTRQHLLASGDSVWVGLGTQNAGEGLRLGSVVRIDAGSNAVVARTEDVDVRGPLTIIGDQLWAGSSVIDVATGEKLAAVSAPDPGQAFSVGPLVWITGTVRSERLLFGIDPGTFRVVKEVPLESYASAAAVGFDSVWLEHDDGVVTRWATEAFR